MARRERREDDYSQESAYRQREEQQRYAQAGYGETGGYGRGEYGQGGGYGWQQRRDEREQGGYSQGGYSQGVPGQGGGYGQAEFQPGYGGLGAEPHGGQAVGGAGVGGYIEGAFGQGGGFGQRGFLRGGFRGRGPRGYQRSDERIMEDVCERLADDDWVDAGDIEVTVAAGEVTLNGTAPQHAMKRRAEDIADSVSGVQHVQNNLRINREGERGQPPAERGKQSTKKPGGSRPR